MNWLTNVVRPKIRNYFARRDTPENLWIKCPETGQLVFYKDVEANQFVIPGSNYHMRMGATARLKSIFDNETWFDIAVPDVPLDPLKFRDERRYTDRLKDARSKTGTKDAIKLGLGKLEGQPVVIRIFIVVRVARKVQHEGVGGPEVLQSVPDPGRDDDEGRPRIAGVELQQLSVSGTGVAPVIKDDLEVALIHEQPVHRLHVTAPGANGRGEETRLIRMHHREAGGVPLRAVGLGEHGGRADDVPGGARPVVRLPLLRPLGVRRAARPSVASASRRRRARESAATSGLKAPMIGGGPTFARRAAQICSSQESCEESA